MKYSRLTTIVTFVLLGLNILIADDPKEAGPDDATAKLTNIPPDPYGEKAKPFLNKQAKILTAIVSGVDTKGYIAGTVRITATTGSSRKVDDKTQLTYFANEANDQMKSSLHTGTFGARYRYPHWEDQKGVVMSLEKGTKPWQDTGSTSSAYALLLLSILDGFKLQPNTAVVGGVTKKWEIEPAAQTLDMVRAAILDKVGTIIVPHANKDLVWDMALLDGLSSLWKIQIIEAKTLQDIIRHARTDAPANVVEARKRFASVQKGLNEVGMFALRKSTVDELSKIVELDAMHLSARLLLEAATKKRPFKLSEKTATEQIVLCLHDFLPYVIPRSPRTEYFSVIDPIPTKSLKETHRWISSHMDICPEGLMELYTMSEDLLRSTLKHRHNREVAKKLHTAPVVIGKADYQRYGDKCDRVRYYLSRHKVDLDFVDNVVKSSKQ